jgi:hypothetical protein
MWTFNLAIAIPVVYTQPLRRALALQLSATPQALCGLCLRVQPKTDLYLIKNQKLSFSVSPILDESSPHTLRAALWSSGGGLAEIELALREMCGYDRAAFAHQNAAYLEAQGADDAGLNGEDDAEGR